MNFIFQILFKDILKVFSIFNRNDSLMSKETIDLLSNPSTRKEFIEFTSGKEDNTKSNTDSRKKKFTLTNGEEITVVSYS